MGDSFTLNLTARANPGPISYLWTRLGEPLTDSASSKTELKSPVESEQQENRVKTNMLIDVTTGALQRQQNTVARGLVPSWKSFDPQYTMKAVIDSNISGVKADGPLLRLTNIQITHGGAYELTAANPQGETRISVNVNVKCE